MLFILDGVIENKGKVLGTDFAKRLRNGFNEVTAKGLLYSG